MPCRWQVGRTSASTRAHEHRVRRLLGDEPLQTPLARHPLRLDDLARGERRVADVADLALEDEVGERAERLLDVGVGSRAVDMVEVDPVGAAAGAAILDLADDPAARGAPLVRVVAHGPWNFVARMTSSRRPPGATSDDLLGLAARVDIGGVDEVDPRVERGVDDPDRLVVVAVAPVAEHHRAEAELLTETPVHPVGEAPCRRCYPRRGRAAHDIRRRIGHGLRLRRPPRRRQGV